MTLPRIRRKRSDSANHTEEQKTELTLQEFGSEPSLVETHAPTQEVTTPTFDDQLNETRLVMMGDIDQIRAELLEEQKSTLVESEYWDETHNWDAAYELESEDYWHFLGRYE